MIGKRRRRKLALLALLGAAALLLTAWDSATNIRTTAYRARSPKLTAPVRAVLLVDTHAHSFGKENAELLSAVRSQQPDLILFAGDGLNAFSETDDYVVSLVRELVKIAPVYYALGNHEMRYLFEQKSLALLSDIRSAGAVLLDHAYADITVHGQRLRIGGLFDRVYDDASPFRSQSAAPFLADFEDTDAYKLLLAHQPDFLLNDQPDARWDIDLALCGHEHGGQVRLPIVGGFYSPHLGFASPYLQGAHLINGIPTVISRGLATYGPVTPTGVVPPRLFNPPELLTIELCPQEEVP